MLLHFANRNLGLAQYGHGKLVWVWLCRSPTVQQPRRCCRWVDSSLFGSIEHRTQVRYGAWTRATTLLCRSTLTQHLNSLHRLTWFHLRSNYPTPHCDLMPSQVYLRWPHRTLPSMKAPYPRDPCDASYLMVRTNHFLFQFLMTSLFCSAAFYCRRTSHQKSFRSSHSSYLENNEGG